jgi:hypothetical protein
VTRTNLALNGHVGRVITTHEAVVKTATIQIKTLAIRNKQVTLAVFRQLQQEDLLDQDTCEVQGIPWGRVNYHPDRANNYSGTEIVPCQHAPAHIHVVWQKDDELRRAYVPERWPMAYWLESEITDSPPKGRMERESKKRYLERYTRVWSKQYAWLAQLDQLFIAV